MLLLNIWPHLKYFCPPLCVGLATVLVETFCYTISITFVFLLKLFRRQIYSVPGCSNVRGDYF